MPETKTERYVFGIAWIDDVGWDDPIDDEHNRINLKENVGNNFDLYLNTCMNQGLRTIRTEEAILISLAVIRPELDKIKNIV